MKKGIYLVIYIFMLLLIGCSGKKENIIILTEDYPPLSYLEKDTLSGYGTEVVKELLKKSGIKSNIQITSWSEAYNTALNKENVIIYTIEKTPERADLFYWIGPIGSNVSSVYVLKDSGIKVKDLGELRGLKSIATTTNWFTEQYLKGLGFSNLNSLPFPEDNLIMLKKKKSQATVLTDITYPLIVKKAGYKETDFIPVMKLMETQFYIGLSKKSSPALYAKLLSSFNTIKQDSTLSKLQIKWKIRA